MDPSEVADLAKLIMEHGGQPRDENCETAYALFDASEKRASILRVAYDIETEVARIAAAGLPSVLGERLRLGI